MGEVTVRDALVMMSDRTRKAMIRYAAVRVRRCHLGISAEDLFHDAVLAALRGDRVWYRENVDFYGFICGVMRSLSTHLADRLSTKSEVPTAGRGEDADDDLPDAERVLIAHESIALVRRHFSDDALVLSLLESMDQKQYGTEFKNQHGLDQRQLETVAKRLRRGALRVLVGV